MGFRRHFLTMFLLVGITVGVAPGQNPERYSIADLKALEKAFVQLGETVESGVVAIRTFRLRNPEADRTVQIPYSQGSGFIVSADGYLVTNRHVLEDADLITVILHDGKKFEAALKQGDQRSDLAVLKIDAVGLSPVRWGDVGAVRVNQWAFACGNPFGLALDDGKPSVSYGVVSALGRQLTQRLVGNSPVGYYGNLIETSASINPGNSGGPLFNLNGEVIGVVCAIETSSGIHEGRGFAIPIDKYTRRIIDTLKDGEVVHYGFLGVNVRDPEVPPAGLVAQSRQNRGAKIDKVAPEDSPASKAGLRPGDIVLEIDGVPIENSDHLVRLVGFTQVGSQTTITFVRDGVKRKTTVTMGDRATIYGAATEE